MNKAVESMIADHIADALAIEYLAMSQYEATTHYPDAPKWKDLTVSSRCFWLIEAKRIVLAWLNREQGTDYKIED